MNVPPRNSWKQLEISKNMKIIKNFGVRMSVLPEGETNHRSTHFSNGCLPKHVAIEITVYFDANM